MQRWQEFINAGLDPAHCDSDLLRRARSVQGAALMMGVACGAFAIRSAGLGDVAAVVWSVSAAFLVSCLAVWLTRTQRVGVAGHLLVAGMFAALCASTAAMGGFYDASFGWTYTLPLVAALLISRPAALGWAAIAIATQASFWALSQVSPHPSVHGHAG